MVQSRCGTEIVQGVACSPLPKVPSPNWGRGWNTETLEHWNNYLKKYYFHPFIVNLKLNLKKITG